jgi:hypothetical protein
VDDALAIADKLTVETFLAREMIESVADFPNLCTDTRVVGSIVAIQFDRPSP